MDGSGPQGGSPPDPPPSEMDAKSRRTARPGALPCGEGLSPPSVQPAQGRQVQGGATIYWHADVYGARAAKPPLRRATEGRTAHDGARMCKPSQTRLAQHLWTPFAAHLSSLRPFPLAGRRRVPRATSHRSLRPRASWILGSGRASCQARRRRRPAPYFARTRSLWCQSAPCDNAARHVRIDASASNLWAQPAHPNCACCSLFVLPVCSGRTRGMVPPYPTIGGGSECLSD